MEAKIAHRGLLTLCLCLLVSARAQALLGREQAASYIRLARKVAAVNVVGVAYLCKELGHSLDDAGSGTYDCGNVFRAHTRGGMVDFVVVMIAKRDREGVPFTLLARKFTSAPAFNSSETSCTFVDGGDEFQLVRHADGEVSLRLKRTLRAGATRVARQWASGSKLHEGELGYVPARASQRGQREGPPLRCSFQPALAAPIEDATPAVTRHCNEDL